MKEILFVNKKIEFGAGLLAISLLLAGCGAKKASHSKQPAKSHTSAVKKSNGKTLAKMPKNLRKTYAGKAGRLNITETVKPKRLVIQKNRMNRKVARCTLKIRKINKCGNRYSVVSSLKGKTVKVWLEPKAKGQIKFNQKAIKATFIGKTVNRKAKNPNRKSNRKVIRRNRRRSQMPGMSNRNTKKDSRAVKHANKANQ